MADDDRERFTVRLRSETAEQLRAELSHFTTKSARFQFLAQFYLDYKESEALPAKMSHEFCREEETNSNRSTNDATSE